MKSDRGNMLPKEEYVEQTHLFRSLANRLDSSDPLQDLLFHAREEVLATTKLPMAIDYMLAELNHVGTMSSAMQKLPHYFTSFQTYIVSEAENEKGRFDMRSCLFILEHEAKFRSDGVESASLFFFQFETLCRNRLSYDKGLSAISSDPIYDPQWQNWILKVRHQIGIVDLADLVYVHSKYNEIRQDQEDDGDEKVKPILFDERVGRIALANRKKEPLYFFAALQRQIGYPEVPKPKRHDPNINLLPKLQRTLEQIEVRLKLLEDEQRGKGIDLSQFYGNSNFKDLDQD